MRGKLIKLCATRFEMSTSDYVDAILALFAESLPGEIYVYETVLDKDIHPQMAYGMGWRNYHRAVKDLLK